MNEKAVEMALSANDIVVGFIVGPCADTAPKIHKLIKCMCAALFIITTESDINS